MSNCLLSMWNHADAATLSGGVWTATMPRANLLDPVIGYQARTVDSAPASTQFDTNLGGPKSVRVFAVISHNLSAAATYRLRASSVSNDYTSPIYDSGTVSACPSTYLSSELPWEADGFWDAAVISSILWGGQPALICVLPSAVAARYWRLEIVDANNSSNYVQLGRLFIGDAMQPATNFSWGATIGYQDDTSFDQALSGTEYADRRPVRRMAMLRFDWLSDPEAYQGMLEMQRLRGTSREILLIWDPDDAPFFYQRSFLCRAAELSPIELARLGTNATTLKLRELI